MPLVPPRKPSFSAPLWVKCTPGTRQRRGAAATAGALGVVASLSRR